MFAPGVKERRKPPGTSLERSHRRRPRQPAATSLLNDVRSPTRRLAGANAHRLLSCESELRVRSCGFPPDLRVSGARQRILRPSTSVETSRPRPRFNSTARGECDQTILSVGVARVSRTTIPAVHCVYIVRCADGTLYTGYARDPDARVKAHNAGRGARYTSGRRPVRLLYVERFESVGDALRRERALKQRSRAQKEALIGRHASRLASGRRSRSN